ncbi:MAG TPA: hypothetical protein VGI03_16695 [Verrucomicrobiae bacterium]|jgi:hypothetical protein
MKTYLKSSITDFRLKLPMYDGLYYVKRALKLEAVLKNKPKVLHLEMIGEGEIPADTALLIRSILMGRPRGTELVTHARSSLQGGSVLVWLLGDRRVIRDDARVFFKRNPLADENLVEVYAGLGEPESKYKDSYSAFDPEDADYARVLKLIDEFLPVRQFAGRIININLLREFGLVDNQRADVPIKVRSAKSREAMAAT